MQKNFCHQERPGVLLWIEIIPVLVKMNPRSILVWINSESILFWMAGHSILFWTEKPGVSKPRASTHHKQGAVAVMRLRPASLRVDPLGGTPTQQESRSSNHIQRKLSTFAKNTCAECQTASIPCLERARSTQAYLAAPVSPVPGQRHLRVRPKPGPLVAFRS